MLFSLFFVPTVSNTDDLLLLQEIKDNKMVKEKIQTPIAFRCKIIVNPFRHKLKLQNRNAISYRDRLDFTLFSE